MKLYTTIAALALLAATGCQDQPLAGEAVDFGVSERSVTAEDFACDSCEFDVGDVNETGNTDIWDFVDLIDYLYGGIPLDNHGNGDVNGDGAIDVSDIIYLSDYVTSGGAAPIDRPCYSNCDAFCAEEIAGLPAEDLVEATAQCLASCEFILPIVGAPEECRVAL